MSEIDDLRDLLRVLFMGRTEEGCNKAEKELLNHPQRAILFDVATNEKGSNIVIRGLAARYFTQCFPDDQKVSTLGSSEETLIRLGVVVGLCELEMVDRLVPFLSDCKKVVREYAESGIKGE